MLFLDGVYVDGVNGSAARLQWVKAPTDVDPSGNIRTGSILIESMTLAGC